MKLLMLSLVVGSLLIAGTVSAQDEDLTAMAYGTVNVRSGPGAQYEIVGQLAAGDRLPVDGRDADGEWLRVILEVEEKGWVASFAVLADGNIMELPVRVEAAAGAGDAVTVSAYGVVNLRTGPGMNYPITGQLEAGDELPVLGRDSENNDWLYVQRAEIQGWVAYFTVTVRGDTETLPVLTVAGSGQTVVPEDNIIYTRFNVRLRASASSQDKVLLVVPFGSRIIPLARTDNGNWLYVLYQETAGWGVTELFDITEAQLDNLPVYNAVVLTATPTVLPPTPTATPGG